MARSLKILEAEVIRLQHLTQNGNQDHINDLKFKTSALSDLLGLKVQVALIRSRFQNEMDAPSQFFFGLEKKNGQWQFINVLQSENGVLHTDPIEIRKRAFYENDFMKNCIKISLKEINWKFLKNLLKNLINP